MAVRLVHGTFPQVRVDVSPVPPRKPLPDLRSPAQFYGTRRRLDNLALPETLISSVEIIGQPAEFQVRVKLNFDNPIEWAGGNFLNDELSVFDGVNTANPTQVEEVGDDYIILLDDDWAGHAGDITTWAMPTVPAGLTSPGRTIPDDQSGSVSNLKTLITSVVIQSEFVSRWTFDNDITSDDFTDAAWKIDENEPTSRVGTGSNFVDIEYGISLTDSMPYVYGGDGMFDGGLSSAGRYVPYPQTGSISA